MRYVKQFEHGDDLETRINEWVDIHRGSVFIETITRLPQESVLVLYTLDSGADSPKGEPVKETERMLKPLPLKEGARSPTWEATMRDQEGTRAAPVMAGVFPVPEGFKLHPEDSEPAPPVLMAKNTDLSRYTDLFGNI